MEKICETEKCVGCGACCAVCAVGAVEMKENEIGHLVPSIDKGKCVDCGRCKAVCPAENETELKMPQNIYAAINKNSTDYKTASSGGMGTLFAKAVTERGGVVYGAAYEGDEVRHIRAASYADIERLKGSKYVQSNTADVYKQVKADLDKGLEVLYIGTPCQTDAISNYLGDGYDRLIKIDLICHGVPPMRLLREHLREICKAVRLDEYKISFREKEGPYLSIVKDGELIYRKHRFLDLYYRGFMQSMILRDSCYSCKYAKEKRVGDITMGDFWGINKKNPFPADISDGVSLVLVNTDKGKRFFDSCKDKLVCQERELDEAVKQNPCLRKPSKRYEKSERFKRLYPKLGFKRAAFLCMWKSVLGHRALELRDKLKKR